MIINKNLPFSGEVQLEKPVHEKSKKKLFIE